MGKFSWTEFWEKLGLSMRDTPVTTGTSTADDNTVAQVDDSGFGSSRRPNKVVDFPQQRGESSAIHEAVLYILRSCDDCRYVIDDILMGRSVLLNLEELKSHQIQRVIDMLSGATYAEEAIIRKIAVNTYYLAPHGVKVWDSPQNESKNSRSSRPSSESRLPIDSGYGPDL